MAFMKATQLTILYGATNKDKVNKQTKTSNQKPKLIVQSFLLIPKEEEDNKRNNQHFRI